MNSRRQPRTEMANQSVEEMASNQQLHHTHRKQPQPSMHVRRLGVNNHSQELKTNEAPIFLPTGRGRLLRRQTEAWRRRQSIRAVGARVYGWQGMWFGSSIQSKLQDYPSTTPTILKKLGLLAFGVACAGLALRVHLQSLRRNRPSLLSIQSYLRLRMCLTQVFCRLVLRASNVNEVLEHQPAQTRKTLGE